MTKSESMSSEASSTEFPHSGVETFQSTSSRVRRLHRHFVPLFVAASFATSQIECYDPSTEFNQSGASTVFSQARSVKSNVISLGDARRHALRMLEQANAAMKQDWIEEADYTELAWSDEAADDA